MTMMNQFDIVSSFPDKAWLTETAARLDKKMRYAVQEADKVDFIPYTTENGKWKPMPINWWTNGFWPASMWQMYLATGDKLYHDEALRAEKMLDASLKDFKTLSHDVGFMWLIQSGVHYALEGNQDSFDRTLFAADALAARYNPNGFIRAWNGAGKEGWAIVDCMMNLPLLYWASRETGDPRYKLIAQRHADTTIRCFVREDGSCNHIVCFDPETGEMLDNPGGQGFVSGSSWSRGQAWALYGFALSCLLSGEQRYLDASKRVANYFISQITDDYIPRCDFRQPAEPNLKDNTAGAVAASGLLLLSRLVPDCEAQTYYDVAVKMLLAMEKTCINWELNDPALLTKCTSAYHDIPGRHITMNYADYYFMEAVGLLRGEKMFFWNPEKRA